MKQKLFLSSMLIMSVASAIAETFPTDGYMKENKTYDNAATETNMDGVYSGTVNAVAEYDVINYIVNAGQYLPADSETVITCPAGSFCPGISGNVQYNQSASQGIQTCPTGYASSAAGASSDTQCYRACDINNMGTNGSIANIAHATAISGNDYYGNGTDTCEPTACENGYHVDSGSLDLTSLIGVSEAGVDNGYKSNSDSEYSPNYNESKYGITQNGEFVVDYGTKGIIKGHAQCSSQDRTTTTTLPDSAGYYCYCQLDSYTPVSSGSIALSAPWVYHYEYDDDDDCELGCAQSCAQYMLGTASYYLAFRAAMLGSVTSGGSGTATCEANTITITWSNADANDISANNAGTATYGSDVRTPVKAQTIKGKTFKGWRFSKPTQVQSCDSITDQSTCMNKGYCTWSGGKCSYKYAVVPEEEPIETGGGN